MRRSFHAIEKLVRYAVYSNIWLAFSVMLWTLSVLWINDGMEEWRVAGFSGMATLFAYNYQRIIKLNKTSGEYIAGRPNWILRKKAHVTLIASVGLLGTIYFSLALHMRDLLFLIIPTGLTMLYVIPGTGLGKYSLRDLPYLKIYLIVLSWLSACYFLPLVHLFGHTEFQESSIWIHTLEKGLFILAITIPFDIRDLDYDAHEKRTIPQILGIKKSRNMAMYLLLGSLLLTIFSTYSNSYDLLTGSAIALSYVLTGVLILFSDRKRRELYYTGLLDGTPALQAMLVILFS